MRYCAYLLSLCVCLVATSINAQVKHDKTDIFPCSGKINFQPLAYGKHRLRVERNECAPDFVVLREIGTNRIVFRGGVWAGDPGERKRAVLSVGTTIHAHIERETMLDCTNMPLKIGEKTLSTDDLKWRPSETTWSDSDSNIASGTSFVGMLSFAPGTGGNLPASVLSDDKNVWKKSHNADMSTRVTNHSPHELSGFAFTFGETRPTQIMLVGDKRTVFSPTSSNQHLAFQLRPGACVLMHVRGPVNAVIKSVRGISSSSRTIRDERLWKAIREQTHHSYVQSSLSLDANFIRSHLQDLKQLPPNGQRQFLLATEELSNLVTIAETTEHEIIKEESITRLIQLGAPAKILARLLPNQQAANALVKVDAESAIDHLLNLVHQTPELRPTLRKALATSAPQALNKRRTNLNEPLFFLHELSHVRQDAEVERWIEEADTESFETRWYQLKALGRVGPKSRQAKKRVLSALDAEEWMLREAALTIICATHFNASERANAFSAFAHDETPRVRIAALACASPEQHTQVAKLARRDSWPSVRVAAISRLAHFDGHESILRAAIADRSHKVRTAAIHIAINRNDDGARKRIRARLQSKHEWPDVTEAAAKYASSRCDFALEGALRTAIERALVSNASERQKESAMHAIKALADLGSDRGREFLKQAATLPTMLRPQIRVALRTPGSCSAQAN